MNRLVDTREPLQRRTREIHNCVTKECREKMKRGKNQSKLGNFAHLSGSFDPQTNQNIHGAVPRLILT